jgi:hypothetical protein
MTCSMSSCTPLEMMPPLTVVQKMHSVSAEAPAPSSVLAFPA